MRLAGVLTSSSTEPSSQRHVEIDDAAVGVGDQLIDQRGDIIVGDDLAVGIGHLGEVQLCAMRHRDLLETGAVVGRGGDAEMSTWPRCSAPCRRTPERQARGNANEHARRCRRREHGWSWLLLSFLEDHQIKGHRPEHEHHQDDAHTIAEDFDEVEEHGCIDWIMISSWTK